MKTSDLRHGRIETVELEPLDDTFGGDAPSEDSDVQLRFPEESPNPLLVWEDGHVQVHGRGANAASTLERMGRTRLPRLAWVMKSISDAETIRSLVIQTHAFSEEYRWHDAMQFGIDEKIVENVRRRHLARQSPAPRDEVLEWLTDQLCIEMPPMAPMERALILSAGPQRQQRGRLAAFRIHGHRIAADVRRTDEGSLRVERIVGHRQGQTPEERRPLFLAHVDASFVDVTVAGQLDGGLEAELEGVLNRQNSYLSLWETYNRLELQDILAKARQVGYFPYTSVKRGATGNYVFEVGSTVEVRRQISELRQTGRDGRLEVAETIPEWLQTTFEDDELRELVNKRRPTTFYGDFEHWAPQAGELTVAPPRGRESIPPPSGYVYLSLHGQFVNLRRRWQAEERIRKNETGMRQLRLLLEGAKSLPTGRHEKHKAITPRVRQVFGGEPTTAQRRAIDIAINTPDIAVIQGPPGTGKTKTTAAIMARLAEIDGDESGRGGHTLLSSFQHDAVEHAAGETDAMALPAVKIGGRNQGSSTDVPPEESWRQRQIHRIEQRAKDAVPVDAQERRLRDLIISFTTSPPSHARTLEVLERLIDEVRDISAISGQMRDELVELRQEVERPAEGASLSEAKRRILQRRAWGLRTNPTAFSDDGPDRAYLACDAFAEADLLDPQQASLLKRAADWFDSETPPFLDDLSELRDELLDRVIPDAKPVNAPLEKRRVTEVLSRLLGELAAHRRKSLSGIDSALVHFMEDLAEDPVGVRETIQRYTSVLAATCQQAASRPMHTRLADIQRHTLRGASQVGEFETVVVDEAARANPLDLFIPMSMADRRIILVGDHRQLPHLLDRQIEEELTDRSVSDSTEEMLQLSLFERLYDYLSDKKRSDGHVRTVTLDRQYRMHPTLGDFVSRVFYEPHGDARIESGRPASDFQHSVPDTEGKVAAWIDVPRDQGQERRGAGQSTSTCRPVEASITVDRAIKWMKACPHLNVGIITFYKAQEKRLQQELVDRDIASWKDDGFQLRKKWREVDREDGSVDARLQVGTVDAFQGKEFDIVLLSMTRSNDKPDHDRRAQRAKYGHLMLANRLCVAMSRQKRLLAVVGDSDMLRGDVAAEVIPGLVQFHDLCTGDDGVLL